MIHPVIRSFRLFVAGLLSASSLYAAQKLVVEPGSSLWLTGDSTLHPFTSRTAQLGIKGSIDASAESASITPFDAALTAKALKTLDLSIAVASLKSNESGLDKNMYKALNSEQCPVIAFHLVAYDVVVSSDIKNPSQVKASGNLTVSCHEKPITVDADLTQSSKTLRVKGHYTLLMTDYGIKPPTMMMGTIKVKNPITVHYDLQLGLSD